MIQFYETYSDNVIVAPLVTQISWTNNIVIFSHQSSIEEKEFYIRLCIKNNYSEKDLQKSIIENLKDFILEIGKDFTFVAKEFRISVGDQDNYIDLLFYNRRYQCLVAFELKVTKFIPEYISKMNFYLEALDREYKMPNENSIGIILCTDVNKTIVEYASARTVSPAYIATYSTKLIDEELLKRKLNEYQRILKNRLIILFYEVICV